MWGEVRMPIRQMFGNLTFEPADIEAMSRALEAACVALRLSKREEPLRQIVARKVIECAATGERDPGVLCRMVVLNSSAGLWMISVIPPTLVLRSESRTSPSVIAT
jgi:hypothetical protein